MLEVAVALAILAVAFTALATLQARNLSLTSENRTITTETLAARDIITRLQTGMLPLEDGEGEVGEDFPGWRWRVRTSELELEGLWSAEVSIFQEESDPEHGVSFRLLLRHEEET